MNAALEAVHSDYRRTVADDFERPPHSGIQVLPVPCDDGVDPRLVRLQDQFIECWARMAGAFAMDRTMGRVHALIYVSTSPVDVSGIALRLGTTEELVSEHVAQLSSWGLISALRAADGRVVFEAEQDPWSWFLRTIRERHVREFMPMFTALRGALNSAREYALASRDPAARQTLERIQRFARFVEEFARLIEAFVTLGAKPMATVLKTIAKLMPRTARTGTC
jgi:DNA-binding transcriptional regulator GbsR (MarR family)